MSHPAYSTESSRNSAGKPTIATVAKAAKAATPAAAAPGVGMLCHPDDPNITIQFELITSAVAEHYLGKLPDWQRNESEPTTEEYVDDMLDGDWLFTGDPIRFTAAGELFDGQHRCQAILASGKPQRVLVIRGLPQDVMKVLDTGYQRKFTNYLQTLQPKLSYISKIAAITGKTLDWRRGNYAHASVARVPNSRHLNAKKSHQKLIHTFEGMREEIITAAREGAAIGSRLPRGSVSDTVIGFAYLYLRRLDPYKCEEFFGELTGRNTQASSDPTYPIRALEKTLVARSGEKGIASYNWLSWIFLTWNEWVAEQPLSKERFRALRRPRWDWLPVPTDPHAETREQGWQAL